MSAPPPASRDTTIAGIGITMLLALFAITFMWLFRPGVGGCAALPPGGDCVTYTDSRYAIPGTVAMVVLTAALIVVLARVRPPRRAPLLVALSVLMAAVLVTVIVLGFTTPLPVPEGVFP